jgi:hypothetical protein
MEKINCRIGAEHYAHAGAPPSPAATGSQDFASANKLDACVIFSNGAGWQSTLHLWK